MENKLSDFELIERIKSGETNALREIVEKYELKVAGTIYGMLGNCPEAEEIGQDVFIRFYNSIGNFRGDSQLSTYLVRIAINLSLNEIKRRKRKRMIFSDEKNGRNLESINYSEINPLEKKDIVEKAMNSLEPKSRAVLILRIIDGYSTAETAEILNIPVGTVLSRFSRAQNKIKNILTPLMKE